MWVLRETHGACGGPTYGDTEKVCGGPHGVGFSMTGDPAGMGPGHSTNASGVLLCVDCISAASVCGYLVSAICGAAPCSLLSLCLMLHNQLPGLHLFNCPIPLPSSVIDLHSTLHYQVSLVAVVVRCSHGETSCSKTTVRALEYHLRRTEAKVPCENNQ